MAAVDCDPTHHIITRADIPLASICSIPSLQKGGALLKRRIYHKENPKHYRAVNECRTASDAPRVPHDFFPCQAYLIFNRWGDKFHEGDRNDVTYLICQGQEVVVEEDGGDRNHIVLVVILHSESQK